jgi:heme exporter protein D
MAKAWRDYGLGIVYGLLFLVTLGLHALFVWWASLYSQEKLPWLIDWLRGFFENVQSENYQIGLFIVLSAYLTYKKSPQSKDGDEQRDAVLQDVLQRLERIERKVDAKSPWAAEGSDDTEGRRG